MGHSSNQHQALPVDTSRGEMILLREDSNQQEGNTMKSAFETPFQNEEIMGPPSGGLGG